MRKREIFALLRQSRHRWLNIRFVEWDSLNHSWGFFGVHKIHNLKGYLNAISIWGVRLQTILSLSTIDTIDHCIKASKSNSYSILNACVHSILMIYCDATDALIFCQYLIWRHCQLPCHGTTVAFFSYHKWSSNECGFTSTLKYPLMTFHQQNAFHLARGISSFILTSIQRWILFIVFAPNKHFLQSETTKDVLLTQSSKMCLSKKIVWLGRFWVLAPLLFGAKKEILWPSNSCLGSSLRLNSWNHINNHSWPAGNEDLVKPFQLKTFTAKQCISGF